MNDAFLSSTRNLFTLFADDVRQEVGNKLTIVGIYQSQMLVPRFPLVLPKLAIVMAATTAENDPFEELVFEVLRDDTLLQDVSLSPEEILVPFAQAQQGTEERTQVQCVAILGPLQIDAPCSLHTRLRTESGILRGASLQILHSPGRQTTH